MTLVRWEWWKVRSRRVIWVLLAILVGFGSLMVLIRYADYQFQVDKAIVDEVIFSPNAVELDTVQMDLDCTAFVETGQLPDTDEFPAGVTAADVDRDRTAQECRKEIAGREGRFQQQISDFTLPGANPKAVRWAVLLGIPFSAFVTVMVIGSEYVWGTLRTSLMKGVARWRFLLAKLILLAIVFLSAWIAVAILAGLTSLVVTAFASGVGHGDVGWALVGNGLEIALRAWWATLPYMVFAALLVVLFSRSSGGTLAAVGVAVGVFFMELFSVGWLIKLFDGQAAFRWFASLAEFDLGWNTAAIMYGDGGTPVPGFSLGGAIGVTDYPSDLHAFASLAVWLAVIGWAAFWLIRRRDVTGPSG